MYIKKYLAFDFCRFAWSFVFFHPRQNGQWPPTSKDFYTRSYLLHFFLILILEKESVFPFSMLSAKQVNYWYYFYNVFGMTRLSRRRCQLIVHVSLCVRIVASLQYLSTLPWELNDGSHIIGTFEDATNTLRLDRFKCTAFEYLTSYHMPYTIIYNNGTTIKNCMNLKAEWQSTNINSHVKTQTKLVRVYG